MTERLPCLVPFCRRSRVRSGDGATEWICWEHWKRIPLAERKVYQRAYIDARPELLAAWKRPPRWLLARRTRELPGIVLRHRRVDRLWQRMKRLAVERADLGSFT